MLDSAEECARAIRTMVVRGAPLIGATAAYGMALAMQVDASDAALEHAHDMLLATRPTAVNLHWALARMRTCCATARATSARTWPGRKPPPSATRMSRSAAPSASTA